MRIGDRGLLGQVLRLELHFQIGQFGFGGLELPFRVEHRLFHFGIAQLDQDRVGFDRRAWQHQDVLDAARANRRDPKRLLGHEQAGAADLPHHVAALDRIQPDLRALDSRRRGLEV